MLSVLALLACSDGTTEAETQPPLTLGGWSVTVHDGLLDLEGEHARLRDLRVELGPGDPDPEIQFNVGSFKFEPTTPELHPARFGEPSATTEGISLPVTYGDLSTTLTLRLDGDALVLDADEGTAAALPGRPWRRLSAACEANEQFTGLGSHAMDVTHVGEAFPLWVAEPGIGKSETDEYPGDWFLTGTRHASSYPVPWLVRPQQSSGLLFDTLARVEVDLCKSDSTRFSATLWGDGDLVLLEADTPLDVVAAYARRAGLPKLPPAWAFSPWLDAIRGEARVRQVADGIRAAGIPASVIWTEDWKGGFETATGYRLSEEWTLDEALYPPTSDIDADLEAAGYKWFAYFAPFVGLDTVAGSSAIEAGALIRDPEGEPYAFAGVTFQPTSQVDLDGAGSTWAKSRMEAARDAGFDGWMTDFAEWLPHDAVTGDSAVPNGLAVHNGYPRQWQQLSDDVLGEHDAAYFCRSGWHGTQGTCPIVWLGDQRTSFDQDDGYPTVIPLTVGLSWSGVGIVTHDVAGYNSIGNPPSTKELWFRWASLGAFSPIFRTHHGAFEADNWQFDTDAETIDHLRRVTTEHMRLFPYRYALAKQATTEGYPMVRAISMHFPEEDSARTDAWLLGPGLLVAPVVDVGASGRHVRLPESTRWVDWWDLAPAGTGIVGGTLDRIPVFLATNQILPLFDTIPDTMVPNDDPEIVGPEEADLTRELLVLGAGGTFTEADGTTYTVTGEVTERATATGSGATGEIEVGGVVVRFEGTAARTYTVRTVP